MARQGVERAEVLASREDTVTSTASVAAKRPQEWDYNLNVTPKCLLVAADQSQHEQPMSELKKLSAYIEYEELPPCIFLYSIQHKAGSWVLRRFRASITYTFGEPVTRPLTCKGNLNQTKKKPSSRRNYSIGLLEHYHRAGPCSSNAPYLRSSLLWDVT